MPLELLDDVIEYVANQASIYGAHREDEQNPCRVCWTQEVKERIWKAVRTEQALERGRGGAS